MRRSSLILSALLTFTACADDAPSQDDDAGGSTTSGTTSEDPSTTAGPGATTDGESTATSADGTTTSGGSSSEGESTAAETEADTEDPGAVTVPLPGRMLFPEGIAADEAGTLYVGSITSSTVLRVDPPYAESDVSEFSQGQLTRGSVGVFVDDAQGVLLVCDSNPGEPVASSLVALDLDTGMRVAEHVLVPAAEGNPVLCNDGVVAADGHAYFSDSFGARVMRVASDDLLTDGVDAEVFLEGPQLGAPGDPPFGANGVTELDGELYVVNFNQGTLLRIPRDTDGNALDIVPIALEDESGSAVTLVGPDGLDASSAGTLVVVENGIFGGGAGNRLVEIELDGDTGVVHEVASDLDIPTTAAEADGRQWVVEGQLDHLFGLDEAPPSPFQLVGVPWG